ncbi:MAG: hypothetical protein V2B19_16750 [Pseudomonadota bacterium]
MRLRSATELADLLPCPGENESPWCRLLNDLFLTCQEETGDAHLPVAFFIDRCSISCTAHRFGTGWVRISTVKLNT